MDEQEFLSATPNVILSNRETTMRKWKCDIFKNNHLKLMRYHIVFSIVWLFMPIGIIYGNKGNYFHHYLDLTIILSVALLPTLIHGSLAYGSFNKIEISREISEFIFGMMLLAFPVGTLLALYIFLPATGWEKPVMNDCKASG